MAYKNNNPGEVWLGPTPTTVKDPTHRMPDAPNDAGLPVQSPATTTPKGTPIKSRGGPPFTHRMQ